jgi:hypothetical protein
MENKYIKATRTFSYDVQEIVQSIRDINNDPELRVSDDEIWNLVSEWVYEDMRSPASRHELIWTDEEGNEI